MKDFATTGFLTNSRKTIQFTIPLDKPSVAHEIYFSKLNIQVRHINGGFLINENVIEGDFTVTSKVEGMGILVNITRSTHFDAINDIPLSVYIVEAEGEFYSQPIPKPIVHVKTFEELMADLLEAWQEQEPGPEEEPEIEPEEGSEEENEGESDTGSEQLHSDTETSD